MKNPEGEGSTIIADELAVSSNLSQAESLLKQAEASGGDSNLEAINVVKAGLRVAERRVAGQVHLVVDGEGDGPSLDSQLKGLLPVTVRGDEESKSFIAIIIDAKILCESGSQAKYRVPSTRGPHVQRLLDGFLSTREDGDLAEGDVLIALDGGKDNDWCSKSVAKYLPSKKYETTKHLITYTYESVEKRMERASKTPLQLHESCTFITQGDVDYKVQARLVASGNTRGNVIGPLTKPSWVDGSETWLLPMSVKRNLFGKSNMPLPGGACPVPHEQDTHAKKDELVPCFYHEAPAILAAELAHFVCARAVVDLTPGSGHWGLHSVRHRIPYVGICLTECHKTLLQKKLVSRTLSCMADPQEETLFDASFAKEIKGLTESLNPQGHQDAEGPPQKKNKTDPKPKQPKPPKNPEKAQPADVPKPDATREELLKKIAAQAVEDEQEAE